MKVVFLCQADYAGSAYQVVKAMNSVGRVEVNQVVFHKHPYEYESGLTFPLVGNEQTPQDFPDKYEKMEKLLAEADLIHTWNNEYSDFFGEMHVVKAFYGNIPRYDSKYRTCTFTGTWYRRHHTVINERLLRQGIKLAVQNPALKYPDEIESEFIPHAINVSDFPIAARTKKLIGCYQGRNTTGKSDAEQLRRLFEKHFPEWEIGLKGTGTHKQRMKDLAECRFFFEYMDDSIGYWGRSTLEASAMGILSFTTLNAKAIALAGDRMGAPIVCDIDDFNWEEVILEAFNWDEEADQKISEQTRIWVDKYFGYEAVGNYYSDFFEGVL